MSKKKSKLTELDHIKVIGAKQHNLKNLSVDLPKNKLVVITGVSGSGKSSLAFDTIFAEGQRRYVESLSSYARQFLGQVEKPDVEDIQGLSPAIAINQKTTSHNPRSTVGTVTEIYDYLRLLYARIGIPHCPVCGTRIEAQSLDQIMDQIFNFEEGSKLIIMAPIMRAKKGEHKNIFSALKSEGFMRVRVDGTFYTLEEPIEIEKNKKHDIDLVIDRVVVKANAKTRIADSVSLALNKGEGRLLIHHLIDKNTFEDHLFSELLSCPNGHGSIPDLDPKLFSFNTPHGACPVCSGLGSENTFESDLIVPVPSLSLKEGAIVPWANTNNVYYSALYDGLAKLFKFDINTPFQDLSLDLQEIILNGYDEEPIIIDCEKFPSLGYANYKTYYEGVIPQLHRRYKDSHSDNWKTEIEKYMIQRDCPACDGSRLRDEARAVEVASTKLEELCKMSVDQAYDWFINLDTKLNEMQRFIAEKLIHEISLRLQFLRDVGLNYLTLNRMAKTLSGGESQRIRLASQIGSGLAGVLYVLDEPSIGLHQRDNERLLNTLQNLRDLGNTVLVVEHDEDTMKAADWLVDIGPGAGIHGGNVISAGTPKDVMADGNSVTGDYLSRRKEIKRSKPVREGKGTFLELKGAKANNLQNINVVFPLGKFITVTGVSGSGKSSLINEILYPAICNKLGMRKPFPKLLDSISGYKDIDKVIVIDQNPIGKTPRSNPATYTGLFDPIRELFSQTVEAKSRGFSPGRFSFNVKGGRCESCSGAGLLEIEMNFLPSVFVKCDVCNGKRYNRETLEVKYKGKSIYDVLEMTVEDALEFFDAIPRIKNKLQTLNDVGLNYITLGQPATTLSGGESQRVKLANELSKRSTGKTLYLLDEPTTGLHWQDIQMLLNVLNKLVDKGNSVILIEHNLDVIRQADYIIDLGPEGGIHGGGIVAQGSPEEIISQSDSHTARFLKILEEDSLKKGKKTLVHT